MKIEFTPNCVRAIKESNDKIYNESLLYYKIKQALNKIGCDLIKKNPDKDGHMFSAPYYLRDRNWKYCFIDYNYAVRDLAKDFNRFGQVELIKIIWNK